MIPRVSVVSSQRCLAESKADYFLFPRGAFLPWRFVLIAFGNSSFGIPPRSEFLFHNNSRAHTTGSIVRARSGERPAIKKGHPPPPSLLLLLCAPLSPVYRQVSTSDWFRLDGTDLSPLIVYMYVLCVRYPA